MLKHFGVYSTEVELNADVTNELLLEPWIVYISSSNIIKYSDGRYVSLDVDEQSSGEQGSGSGEEQGSGSGGSQEPATPVHDYSQDYLTIVMLEDGEVDCYHDDIYYSLDEGTTWEVFIGETISLNSGDRLLLKTTTATLHAGSGASLFITGRHNVEGNMMSVVWGDDFVGKTVFNEYDNTGLSFFNDSYLISAEHLILPATTLCNACYNYMFAGCTNLTTAPVLPANTLATGCYESMFAGCESLNYIKCLATDISASGCLLSWTNNVSSTGTFVKNSSMTSWPTGDDGIPTGWTVQNAA